MGIRSTFERARADEGFRGNSDCLTAARIGQILFLILFLGLDAKAVHDQSAVTNSLAHGFVVTIMALVSLVISLAAILDNAND